MLATGFRVTFCQFDFVVAFKMVNDTHVLTVNVHYLGMVQNF